MPASQVCISKRTFYIFSFAVIAIAVTLLLSSLIISNQNLTLSKAATPQKPALGPVGNPGQKCFGNWVQGSHAANQLYYPCNSGAVCYAKPYFSPKDMSYIAQMNNTKGKVDFLCYWEDPSLTGSNTFSSICGKGMGSPCCPDPLGKGICDPGLECKGESNPEVQGALHHFLSFNPWYFKATKDGTSISPGLCMPMPTLPPSQMTSGGLGEVCYTDTTCDPPYQCVWLGSFDNKPQTKCVDQSGVKYGVSFWPESAMVPEPEDQDISDSFDPMESIKDLKIYQNEKLDINLGYNTENVRTFLVSYSCNYNLLQPTMSPPVPYNPDFPLICGPYTELKDYTIAIKVIEISPFQFETPFIYKKIKVIPLPSVTPAPPLPTLPRR